MECVRCATALPGGAGWCPLCYRRVLDVSAGDLLEELRAAVNGWGWWVPPERHTRPSPRPVFSRLREGPFSFGPRGRVGASLLILAILFVPYAVITAGHPAVSWVGRVVLAVLAFIPLLHVWGRHRVR